ncbi:MULTISPECIES: hypothetical protein [unclassified Thalassospira]|jgi:hypothetical protein|uniref:hypothetical protein n=1 Tax=unclassified Thalassospira TaxID=2648997 RepID=UPI000A1DF39A|nr:hypothetical protein [Thalassospira sp. MCCC 1A01428]OSQ41554.1 hypothetical protein THS27_18850 [Thalassospira sp. MCCC 1A01428]
METRQFWGMVLIVVGAATALIVAMISRRPFRYRHDGSDLKREDRFLGKPLNMLMLVIAVVIFILGLLWRNPATRPF